VWRLGGNRPFGSILSLATILVSYVARLKQNIALAIVSTKHTTLGTSLNVSINTGTCKASIVECPFYDPTKKLASS